MPAAYGQAAELQGVLLGSWFWSTLCLEGPRAWCSDTGVGSCCRTHSAGAFVLNFRLAGLPTPFLPHGRGWPCTASTGQPLQCITEAAAALLSHNATAL